MDKFPVSLTDMESLFDSDGFFHWGIKGEIMTEGATYHTCRSDNGRFCLLIEAIVGKKPNILGSLPWKQEYEYINPFLIKKQTVQSNGNVDTEELVSKVSKMGFIRRGIHQWGIPVFA